MYGFLSQFFYEMKNNNNIFFLFFIFPCVIEYPMISRVMNVVNTLIIDLGDFFACFLLVFCSKSLKTCSSSSFIFRGVIYDFFKKFWLIPFELQKEGKLHYRTAKVQKSRKT